MALMTTSQMLTGIKNWVLGKIANITALIPLQASTSNQLADKAYVNSSVATATATFQGTYNVVSDFSLAYNATHGQIASALATKMAAISATPDNNDYAFVQIPTANATPTEIARIEKYKYNGSAWAFEYNLNNSGFTAAQWAAINSGATLELIGKLSALPTNAELTTLLGGKVDKVSGKGLSTNDYTTEEKNKLGALPTNDALNTALGTKQDVVQDLATIRSGASAGATAVQPTAMSAALVQTVAESGVFDLSAHNAVNGVLATYADLSAALAALNALTSEYKKPGMSFKFVCTYDNKYVQYRLMSDTFSSIVSDWQGVDEEIKAGSKNIADSSAVNIALNKKNSNVIFFNKLNVEDNDYTVGKIIDSNGDYYPNTYSDFFTSGYIECCPGMRFRAIATSNVEYWACFYNKDKIAISSAFIHDTMPFIEVPGVYDIVYMRASMRIDKSRGCLFNSDVIFDTYVEYNKPIIVCEHVSAKYIKNHVINGIESRFIENLFNPNDSDVVNNVYIDPSDGSVHSSNTTFITGYIPCNAGDYLAWGNKTTSTLCAFYDKNKVFIRGYYGGALNPYNTVPDIDEISYVRFSPPKSYKNDKSLYKNYHSDSYLAYGKTAILIDDVHLPNSLISSLQDILSNIDLIEDRISNINEAIPLATNVLNENDADYVVDKVIEPSTGEIYDGTYSGYSTSGFIPCTKGEIYTVVTKKKFERWVCFYDSQKSVMSSYGIHNSAPELVIPDDDDIKYFRISFKVSTIGKYLYNTDAKIPFESAFGKMFVVAENLKVKNDFDVKNITAEKILLNGKDLSEKDIKWEYACCRPICIGDSLTDGLYVPDAQGHYTQGLVNENYPYFLGRILNCDVFNAGKNGSYPSKFYTEWYPSLDFTDYDTVILWLGTNGGLNTADREAANHTPEKEGYYYTQIIDGILAQNPTIKIVLMTVFIVGGISPSVEHGTVSVTNNFINGIASTYNLQVIDMSDLTSPSHPELRNNINNTHFAKAGNIYIANRICENLYNWFNSNPLRCEFGLTTKPAHNP